MRLHMVFQFPSHIATQSQMALAQFGAKDAIAIFGSSGKTWIAKTLTKSLVGSFAAGYTVNSPREMNAYLLAQKPRHRKHALFHGKTILNGGIKLRAHFKQVACKLHKVEGAWLLRKSTIA